VDPTQAVRRELVVLPQPALGPLQLRRLQSLGLAWPDDATLGLLGALPTRLPTPPGPRPRSWWRQVYCLVGMAARLHPHEPRHGAALAAVHCGVLALIAAHAQAALGLAQERARHDAAALDACLAAQGLDLAGLILDLAVHWRLPAGLVASYADPGSALRQVVPVGSWLLHLKRMPAPLAPGVQDPGPAALAGLRLGPEGLVGAITALSEAVDDGRRLARAILELPTAC